MKKFAFALLLLSVFATPVLAEDDDFSAGSSDDTSAKINELISDLGGKRSNNEKVQKCINGGTKKITIKSSKGGTSYSGSYKGCKEFGRRRDGNVSITVGG